MLKTWRLRALELDRSRKATCFVSLISCPMRIEGRKSVLYIPGQRSFHYGSVLSSWQGGSASQYEHFSSLLGATAAEPFTSLDLFKDVNQPLHEDTTNVRYNNLLLACSTFSGGGLCVQSEGGDVGRDVEGTSLPGVVVPWVDGKISLAAYTISQDGKYIRPGRQEKTAVLKS